MDKQTFTAQVLAMERPLYRIARSFLRTDADCADAVQEALTRAWARRGTLREERYFRTWLTRILINECKTLLKGRRRERPMDSLPEPDLPPENPRLRDALDTLDVSDRVPLVLYHLEGYTVEEIAQTLHQPQGTVKSRLHRARKRLREVYEEEVSGDDAL